MTTQLKKGTVELALLKLLSQNDSYGYELGKKLSSAIDVKEGTVYLILQRLEKAGDLSIYFKSTTGAKQRKYYSLCPQGKQRLNDLETEWKKITNFINSLDQTYGKEENE